MFTVTVHLVGFLCAHHVSQITLLSVAEYGGWTKPRQRNTLWPVSLANGRVRVMVWFSVWTGHTQDFCLFYPRISIGCAKCWKANNNPSLILGNPMPSSEGPLQGIGTGGQQVAEGDLVLCANIRQCGQFGSHFVAKDIMTAYLITPRWKCCQSICQLSYTNNYLW